MTKPQTLTDPEPEMIIISTTTTNTHLCLYCKWSKALMAICNRFSWMKIKEARDCCEEHGKEL